VDKHLFNITVYDTRRWEPVKRRMIQRLLEQNPVMKYKTVNQWMKILSLQTDPEVNPATGRADGSYGGAVFAAYNEGGKYYKTFTLPGDKEDGDMNLNITEAEKDSSGNYPVVAEVSRLKPGERDYAVNKVYRKLVPGKKYRIVSTVKNENKLTSTKYNRLPRMSARPLNHSCGRHSCDSRARKTFVKIIDNGQSVLYIIFNNIIFYIKNYI
jgi:hypothetical protein